MTTCLVSLVGEQTIPNILVAAHFKPDFLLFLSTPRMERKAQTQAILKALNMLGLDYEARYKRLVVREDDINDLQGQVNRWMEEITPDYQYLVNLTGGNKLMSLAAYDLFKDFDSRMVYVPISKNEFLEPFPKRRPKPPVPMTTRLTVLQYLTACGVRVVNEHRLEDQAREALGRRELTRFLFSHYRELETLLRRINGSLRRVKREKAKKGFDFVEAFVPENEAQKKLLSDLGFTCRGGEISRRLGESDWNFLRGGWLEERLYLAARDVLPHADVQLGLQFRDPDGNSNEFDVLFTLDNVLHLVECKSLGAGGVKEAATETINAFLYKLGALRQQFGLTPRGFLATTDPKILSSDNQVRTEIVQRARQASTQVIPLLVVSDLEEHIRQLLRVSP